MLLHLSFFPLYPPEDCTHKETELKKWQSGVQQSTLQVFSSDILRWLWWILFKTSGLYSSLQAFFYYSHVRPQVFYGTQVLALLCIPDLAHFNPDHKFFSHIRHLTNLRRILWSCEGTSSVFSDILVAWGGVIKPPQTALNAGHIQAFKY